MDFLPKRNNVLKIKPFRAGGVIEEEAPKQSLKTSGDSKLPRAGSSGLSESTPKRSVALFSENAKTPNDKPVVLDEEFSPIELFPFSQSQSVPIVQWNYNAAQRTTRNGSLRRSRLSCGKIPSPPEMKICNKRRTPSPTIEDMPPFKKSSQEVVSNLQEHLLKLQAIVSDSSDSESEEQVVCKDKDMDGGQLGNSMHQSLHISDKFERSASSPDLFDSAQDNVTEELCLAVKASDSAPIVTMAATEEPKMSTSQNMSFEINDSLAECLIACTEKAETDLRLSQQQIATKPATTGNLLKKPVPKFNNSFRGGKLQVEVTSPRKKTQSPKPTRKPVAGICKVSNGAEFAPKWMENIKSATSPINASFKAPPSGEKNIHRTLFSNSSNKESHSALDKSFDPFEDSFDTDLDQVLAVETVALSQLATAQNVDPVIKPKLPVPTSNPLQRVSSASNFSKAAPKPATSTFSKAAPKPATSNFSKAAPKPATSTFSKAAPKPATSSFKRHLSTPLPFKPQAKPSVIPAPSRPAVSSLQNAINKPIQLKQHQNLPIPSAAAKLPHVSNHKKLDPFPRHRSGDLLGKVASAASTAKSLSASPLLRHRSADFGQVLPASQKCSQQEIERKRLEAKKRLAIRKQSGNRDGV